MRLAAWMRAASLQKLLRTYNWIRGRPREGIRRGQGKGKEETEKMGGKKRISDPWIEISCVRYWNDHYRLYRDTDVPQKPWFT